MDEVTPSPQALRPPDDELAYLTGGTLQRRRNGDAGAGGGDVGGCGGGGAGGLRQFVFKQNADAASLLEFCSRKLAAQPHNVRALMIRASCYGKMGAPHALALSLPARRHRMHDAFPPHSSHALMIPCILTCAAAAAGLLEDALRDYTWALRHQPTSADAAFQRGVTLQQLGRMDEAVEDYTLVLHLEPRHAKAAYARATCNNLAGRFDDANGACAAGSP